ncbi:hypothetical protein CONLIGDRAFT_465596 [Coniochaeta ligniaria NRRL 30616]|uniref:Uncharacterized protein n=1 Tax=Coniochaeta ligniaria NRRL 30616 TaxID=1408157 RepID=A0A1J7IZ17_9PEZI|nr:hypothetical protein CONLIGDRAFT_465596 [Coniochaeta ligniaria NRRL 30616]
MRRLSEPSSKWMLGGNLAGCELATMHLISPHLRTKSHGTYLQSICIQTKTRDMGLRQCTYFRPPLLTKNHCTYRQCNCPQSKSMARRPSERSYIWRAGMVLAGSGLSTRCPNAVIFGHTCAHGTTKHTGKLLALGNGN